MKKINDYFKNPKKIIIYMMNKNYFDFLNDEIYLKWKFSLKFGKNLNLKNPRTFNEKMQWLKLHDRNPEYTKMVDKYSAKEYVGSIIGKEYIIETIGVYDNFNDINFPDLPNKFVIKPTHTSGDIYICNDKSKINYLELKKKVDKWLKRNYYKIHREWPYKNVKPKIIIEKYMDDTKYHELIDYKVMCFNGNPEIIFTCTERFSNEGLKVTFFDLNWEKLPFERHYPSSSKNIKKPINFDKMIELSKKLSKNIPFVRVDWYEINGKLYFGELTFYPGSGYEEFTPEEWDTIIGKKIKIPSGEKNE